MADPRQRHPRNAPGPWFVDRTCIDCDVSRQCAPWMFGSADGQAVVVRQPAGEREMRDAMRALLACPTASIGVVGEKPAADGLFPEPIEGGVFYCGYASRDSFGASAYFVERPEGNLLIDSPRFVPPLIRELEARGGLSLVLLTHRDDVADADAYAKRFGARVVIHEDDARAAPHATDILEGAGPTGLRPGLRAFPVPGHTKGSVAYLLEDRFLFTGDSLYFSRRRQRLSAFRDATWYSWEEQARSLARLLGLRFEWVLPGHGNRAKGRSEDFQRQLGDLVEWMRSAPATFDW
jgi:glyoxylase-like metal-dependent hydrolase (beta-lactamase superfamily II)/ferredoxin